MKIIWFVLFILILIGAYIVAVFKNAFLFLYNISHRRKRAYWNPAVWMTDEHLDVTERFYHD